MKIDKRLYLVVPIYADEEGGDVTAYVHSAPLAEEIVNQYFMILGQTYSAIFSQGLGLAAGPPHAMRVLRHMATERNIWFDDGKGGPGVERGLVEEIRRLTMVAVLKDGKWEQLPLQVACDRGAISAEDRQEVENAIVFFIVASATLGRAQRGPMLRAAAGLWGAQVSSLSFTEWVNFLRTSTATGNSGSKSPAPANDGAEPAPVTQGAKRSSVPY